MTTDTLTPTELFQQGHTLPLSQLPDACGHRLPSWRAIFDRLANSAKREALSHRAEFLRADYGGASWGTNGWAAFQLCELKDSGRALRKKAAEGPNSEHFAALLASVVHKPALRGKAASFRLINGRAVLDVEHDASLVESYDLQGYRYLCRHLRDCRTLGLIPWNQGRHLLAFLGAADRLVAFLAPIILPQEGGTV